MPTPPPTPLHARLRLLLGVLLLLAGLGGALLPSVLLANAGAATVAAAASPSGPSGPAGRAAARGYAFSFLSSPDFLNTDVADVSGEPGYRAGSPNSYNVYYARALDAVLNAFEAEAVPSLLVAGDLVEGHWWIDTADTGTFGSLGTRASRKQVVRRAGNRYYGAWNDMVRDHGLRAYPALGDHEVGDNPWHRFLPETRRKHELVPTYKKVFGDNFLRDGAGRQRFRDRPKGPAKNSAYATRLHPEVQLISVDVFRRTPRNVKVDVDRVQLAWVESVLRRARADGVDWIIVQGHTPVIGPVRVADNSSGLTYPRGKRSKLWKLLQKYDVDAYLAGEVHDLTASIAGGVAQIAHGGTFASGLTNYIRADVTRGRLRIVAKQFTSYSLGAERLWGMDQRKGGPGAILYLPRPRVVGSLELTKDHRMLRRTGRFAPYHP